MATPNQGVAAAVAKPRPEKPWKRYFRTTREGKAFLFVTFGVGLAAINTGNNLLFLIFGFMMSLIVLSGILSEIVLRDLKLRRRMPQRAFAKIPCLIEVELENKKKRAPSYSLELEDLARDAPSERRCYFLKVAPKSVQIASYRRIPARRGLLELTGFRIATRYPFGIIEKWRRVDEPAQLLVYPEVKDNELLDAAQALQGDEPAAMRMGHGTEIAGLRNYQTGDDARVVHWRRSASLGRLVTIERHHDSGTHLTVLLDNGMPNGVSSDVSKSSGADWERGFEHCVSRAAALVLAASRAQLSVEIVCRGSRSPMLTAGGPPDPALRFLALIAHVPLEHAAPLSAAGSRGRVIELRPVPIAEAPAPSRSRGAA